MPKKNNAPPEDVTELLDAATTDLFTEITRGIDKWLCLVQASQQSGN